MFILFDIFVVFGIRINFRIELNNIIDLPSVQGVVSLWPETLKYRLHPCDPTEYKRFGEWMDGIE